MGVYKEGLYITTSLDYASYLIEMDARFLRSTWDGRNMSWTFLAKPALEKLEAKWLSREPVEISPRSYIETRTSLISNIKEQKRSQ